MDVSSLSPRKVLAIGAMLALTVSACATTTVTPSPTVAASAAPTGTAKPSTLFTRGQGGDLKVLYWQAPTILNPHQATGTKDADPSRLVLEPLASYGPDGKPIANTLAASIPTVENGGVSKDLTTVTYTLKPGLKWSDGSAFSVDDVVFTFNYQKDPKSAVTTSDDVDGVKSVEAVGTDKIKVTYDKPNANYYQYGVYSGFVLQKAQFGSCIGEAAAKCPANLKPIGTGPYKIVDFKPNDNISFAMNENFRDASKPFFKTVSWKGGGEAPTAARAAFQTGEVDYAWNLQVDAPLLKSLSTASDAKANLVTVYGNSVERILLNFSNPDPALGDKRAEPDTKHPYLTDLAVRRALAMATDRATVGKELYGDGLAGKASCNIINGPEQYNSTATASFDVCKFDLAAANAELDKAGYVKGADGVRAKGNVRLEMTYQTTNSSVRQSTQTIMKKNWEAIGFKVTLKAFPAGTFFTNTSPDGANHFWADVEMYTNSGAPDPILSLRPTWTTKNIASKANNWQGNNYARYSDATYDKMIDDLGNITDPAKYVDAVKAANDYLIKNVVIIPLVNRTFATSGVSKTLKGVNPSPWDQETYNIQDWYK